MARRRTKKRTQNGDKNGAAGKVTSNKASLSPKSMVIRIGAGEVGPSVSQLVKDVRLMMEPDTASRLKERRNNRLKDYLTMCGPLGVSHLLLFSKSQSGNTNLRLAITPRGPTLHFHIENYSLCKDVMKALKHAKRGGKEYLTAPLLVMNNFTTPSSDSDAPKKLPRHLESLTTTVFQSLFPPISPQTTPLSSIRRVLLLNRELTSSNDDATYIINLRHYAITTRAIGLSRPIRRLNAAEKLLRTKKSKRGGVPNLGRFEDIADYMIGDDGAGYMTEATSGSEVDTDAEVEVVETKAKRLFGKQQKGNVERDKRKGGHNGVQKKAIKLVELGPRLRLRMTKVEEGLCAGKVMWHDFMTKSREEEKTLEEAWEKKRKEKDERRQTQKENVEKKKTEREQIGEKNGGNEDEGREESGMDIDQWDSEGIA